MQHQEHVCLNCFRSMTSNLEYISKYVSTGMFCIFDVVRRNGYGCACCVGVTPIWNAQFRLHVPHPQTHLCSKPRSKHPTRLCCRPFESQCRFDLILNRMKRYVLRLSGTVTGPDNLLQRNMLRSGILVLVSLIYSLFTFSSVLPLVNHCYNNQYMYLDLRTPPAYVCSWSVEISCWICWS
jgi:hypothetical protein